MWRTLRNVIAGGSSDGWEDVKVSGLFDCRPYSGDEVRPVDVEPEVTVYAAAEVVQDDPAPSPAQLRVDFGAHLEAHYQRLVAQLFAITLDPGEAHDVVQDAYSRAWRSWAEISRSPDPTAWIRRIAVRSTIRSWRRVLSRVGIGGPRSVVDGADGRTGALLSALGRLPAAERRCVVLFHMAGMSLDGIAALERATPGSVQARLCRAQQVVTAGMAQVLPAVPGLAPEAPRGSHQADPWVEQGVYR